MLSVQQRVLGRAKRYYWSHRFDATKWAKAMNRLLVALGALLVLVGLCWQWVRKVPWFHLPGDIVIDRPGVKVFIPIATMVIVSLVMSAVAWVMRK